MSDSSVKRIFELILSATLDRKFAPEIKEVRSMNYYASALAELLVNPLSYCLSEEFGQDRYHYSMA